MMLSTLLQCCIVIVMQIKLTVVVVVVGWVTIWIDGQTSVVDINHAFHLYNKCCMWAEFQSIST